MSKALHLDSAAGVFSTAKLSVHLVNSTPRAAAILLEENGVRLGLVVKDEATLDYLISLLEKSREHLRSGPKM